MYILPYYFVYFLEWPSIPLFTFATLGMTGSLISLLLTETSGKPLQDDIVKDGKDNVIGDSKKKHRRKGKRKVVPVDMNGHEVVASIKYGNVVTIESMLAENDSIPVPKPVVRLKRAYSF